MKAALLCVFLAFSLQAQAGTLTPETTREIQRLFTVLEHSGCKFQRNGSWHTPQQASKHLHRKFEYLRERNMITYTESFIALGASTSSLTGKDYQVQCGDKPAVASRLWFTQVLDADRQHRKRGGAGR